MFYFAKTLIILYSDLHPGLCHDLDPHAATWKVRRLEAGLEILETARFRGTFFLYGIARLM